MGGSGHQVIAGQILAPCYSGLSLSSCLNTLCIHVTCVWPPMQTQMIDDPGLAALCGSESESSPHFWTLPPPPEQPGHCCADSGDPMLLEPAMFFVPQLSALMRRNVSRHGTLRRPVASPDPARAGHPREMSTAACAHARRETQKVRIEAWQQPGPEHQGCREAEQQPRAESSL